MPVPVASAALGAPAKWIITNIATQVTEETVDPDEAANFFFLDAASGTEALVRAAAVYRPETTPSLVDALTGCDRLGYYTSIVKVTEGDMLGQGDTDEESDAGNSRADFLARAQVVDAEPFCLGFVIESYDPTARMFTVRVSNNLHEILAADDIDPADTESVAANYDPARVGWTP